MKVRATRLGYYDHLRRQPGVEFELKSDAEFSKKWMEPAEEPSTVKNAEKPKQKPRGQVSGTEVI